MRQVVHGPHLKRHCCKSSKCLENFTNSLAILHLSDSPLLPMWQHKSFFLTPYILILAYENPHTYILSQNTESLRIQFRIQDRQSFCCLYYCIYNLKGNLRLLKFKSILEYKNVLNLYLNYKVVFFPLPRVKYLSFQLIRELFVFFSTISIRQLQSPGRN